ncbi:MAG: Molybdopterin-converting factor subunit 1 [Pseudomonadota bacterium]|jgi:molybdopterin converting factor subunit 1
MKVLYFAWLRTRIGTGEETVAPPASVVTAGQLLDWLAGRSEKHAEALKNRSLVRIAINQEFAGPEAPVKAGDEVALFPPVTGGSAAGPQDCCAERSGGG